MHLDSLFARQGGALATAELLDAGISRSILRRLLQDGRIWRARQGWYVLSGTAPAVLRAVRVGGVLTCARALDAHGLWSTSDSCVHVRVHHSSCRLRTTHDSRLRLAEHPDAHAVVHWSPNSVDSTRLIAGPFDALDDYFSCVERDLALAALDSLIRVNLPRASELRGRFGVDDWVGIDGRCESGIETIFYIRMLRLGVSLWRQVPLPHVGRVDFLIGRGLVVEVDGRRFHDIEEQFESDRARDAAISAEGLRSLRFSHDQVVGRWNEVERAVLAALARGDHL
jgi:very-short-patch-repair endonuclease